MIQTKSQLKSCLLEDLKRFDRKPNFLTFLRRNDDWYIWNYIKTLRLSEYYTNNVGKGLYYKLMHKWYNGKLRKYDLKLRIYISPNVVESGFRIYHLGRIMVAPKARIGRNFTIRPNCVVGYLGDNNDKAPIIEDNVEFSVGASVFGGVKIGRGATLGPYSVAYHNIPPYAMAIGNPARIVGFRYEPEQIVEMEKLAYSEVERIPLKTLEKNYKKYYLDRKDEIMAFLK